MVTLILTQQHGNEPAGTPAALALLEEILAGAPIADTLHNQVLLLWPMVNPDGGEADARANDHGTDLNRDHVELAEPETQAVHDVLNTWDVHVGMDHHEYGGTGLGYPVPVRLYDYDVTTLFPRHGNVRETTMQAALDLMYDAVWPALEAEGYTVNEYGEQTVAGIPIGHAAGGPDPGILRNNFGLHNVAGLLVESFLMDANPFIDAERRTAVQRIVMDATLEYASANAAEMIAAKREAERLNVEEPLEQYTEVWPEDPLALPVDDPTAPGIRAPLAPAYLAGANLDGLMARHGLPGGMVTADGVVYSVVHERGGLLAAIVHPESSRSQAPDAVPAEAPLAAEHADEDTATPALLPLALIAALGVAWVAAARRR